MTEEKGTQSPVSRRQSIKEEEMAKETEVGPRGKEAPKKVSRREFVKGAAVGAAGIAAAGALASCAPAPTPTPTTAPVATATAVTAPECPPCPTPEAVVPEEPEEVRPIPPVDPPTTWDKEADIVVVGTGGGGLAASVKAAEKGNSVIVLEKLSETGGGTKQAAVFIAPGNRLYLEAGLPWDEEAYFRQNLPGAGETITTAYGSPIDPALLRALIHKGAECADWMGDLGVPWAGDPLGPPGVPILLSWKDSTVGGFYPLGMKPVTDFMTGVAEDNGVEFLLSTTVAALVRENGRIVGVQAQTMGGDTIFVKAKKAVILAAGGFTNNREMLKKYVPTGYTGCAAAFGMPCDTGEVIRMGLGAGADMAGLDSFSTFDGGLDYLAYGVGPYHRYLYSGDNQLARQAWLTVNNACERFMFVNSHMDRTTVEAVYEGAQPGHRGYMIFDSHYEENIFKFQPNGCKNPIVPTMPNIDRMPESLAPHDWREAVAY
ncbi:MAG: FAD-dependent oxidoreductase, partial [Anaerolineae bacterium]|nr:FAD-dependent oxidoreductase [Anaerolineae bacterium]